MSAPPSLLRAFIASDLHVHCQDGDHKPSFLDARADETSPGSHPVTGLKALIDKEGLRADLLLCPGDLGDKAVPEAIRRGWRWLNELQTALGARQTLATAGNHDVDSRYTHNDHDARGVLQALQPSFPVSNERDFDRYWSRHYVVLVSDQYRVVLLNSSAFHGSGCDEYQRGRITQSTLEMLAADLKDADDERINILLCHHHPHPHSELNLGEADLMLGGQLLLDLLGSGSVGQWIVIHGHKHHPKISYGQSATSLAPIVFASGSMSAVLYPDLGANVRNQVYLLEFPLDGVRQQGIRATFRAWDWIPATGWLPAGNRSGLPHIGGFGYRERPATLAARMASLITEVSIEWDEVISKMPEVRYLTPADWRLVKSEMESRHYVQVLESDGSILRLERKQ